MYCNVQPSMLTVTCAVSILFLQVAMLVGQSLLLGELVDYFTDVGQQQFLEDCVGVPASSGVLSTTGAYLAAFGEKLLLCETSTLFAVCIMCLWSGTVPCVYGLGTMPVEWNCAMCVW